jgi:tRNA isopentenyl-2-thiomethyl-A-37 hydroxylase MiaE
MNIDQWTKKNCQFYSALLKTDPHLCADYLELTMGIIELLSIDDKVIALDKQITELCDTILVSQTNKGGSHDEKRME